MAKEDKLGCLEKRALLNQPAAAVDSLRLWGERFEEMGLIHDALEFHIKMGAVEEMKRLLSQALEEGDYFLFTRLCRAMEYEPGAEELAALARRAEELGKFAYAIGAYRQGGAVEEAERLSAEVQ